MVGSIAVVGAQCFVIGIFTDEGAFYRKLMLYLAELTLRRH